MTLWYLSLAGAATVLLAGQGVAHAAPDRLHIARTGTDAVVWKINRGTSYVPSPVLHEGRLILNDEDTKLYCLDAKTGKSVWTRPFKYGSGQWRAYEGNEGPALGLMRDVEYKRVEGTVAPVPEAEAEAQWQQRAWAPRLAAWVARQSQVVENRAVLEERLMADSEAEPPEPVGQKADLLGVRPEPMDLRVRSLEQGHRAAIFGFADGSAPAALS